ncbi:hypothetical protein [Paludisphaera rhizosphaerae]|uniref:hypothetical protein n=1 Tax=Paludisphaera rhizosphaerae TaxID=2711216 RepID=UPI0013EB8D7A|nr:hypothetical protein [Paludisphaera rhizosphaerae]
MKLANLLRTAAPVAALVLCSGEAWAQSASPANFGRTRSGVSANPAAAARSGRAPAVERTSTSRLGADPLAPYTSKPPIGTYTAKPIEKPAPAAPVARNYFPTARTGQYQAVHHCTPSRAMVSGRGR